MIEIIKLLLGIETLDTSLDDILAFYKEQAYLMACEYCNVDNLPIKYDNTISLLAVYLYRNKDSLGYKSKSEGEKSISFNSDGIPEYIKVGLPTPRLRVPNV